MKNISNRYRSSFLLPCLILLGTVAWGCGQKETNRDDDPASSKPNIIFILTDDMGWGDVGVFYQNSRKKEGDRSEPWQRTPNLDRLAAEGARLTHHYVSAPVCAPSRASLLSGLSQGHANIRDNQFDKALADNHTMATVLKELGYATAAFGKWGLQGDERYSEDGDEWPAHPLNRGFDYFLGYMRHRDGHEHYPKEGIYRGQKEVWRNRENITPKLDKAYTADLWTAAAKQWITDQVQNSNDDEPFFAYLAYDTPHAVLELPTQPYPEGGGLDGGLQWTGEAGQMINTASGKVDSWVHPDYAQATFDHDKKASTPEIAWPDVYKRYATANRRIDSGVGDIVTLLEDLGVDSNTLIVFTSDNGPSRESYLPEEYEPNKPTFFESFGPFDGIKRDTWEGGIRVPTIAYWPATIPAGQVIDFPSINYDWLPTFVNAAGAPAPAIADGVSLLPELEGGEINHDRTIYLEYFQGGSTPEYEDFSMEHQGRERNQMQVVRMGDYVGVRYDIESAQDDFEIYNVPKDPQQTDNLAQQPENQRFIGKLQQKMKDRALQSRMPNESAPRPYDDEMMPPASNGETEAGVTWKAYDGTFPWVPRVRTLEPAATGKASRPDPGVADKDHRALFFRGYIDVPADGTYKLYLSTAMGAVLRIHDATVIDADYGYRPGTERTGEIKLKAGLHPFRLYFMNGNREDVRLQLQWSGPGISKQPVPPGRFRRGR
ncbi:sulfatase-like hydrolase/transferase [Fodinibius sediminis]|uniref:Arylsulfatase A n=1 Tax=Fodinibius sediminis TaxID=1214077 RepID=A0A521BAA2_9BACT|nr:sulfatase-like hydrolase/transferase [Fodinibius sediminis]SMO44017.1 Arylsulfatase A [Fodinibius sediminis]